MFLLFTLYTPPHFSKQDVPEIKLAVFLLFTPKKRYRSGGRGGGILRSALSRFFRMEIGGVEERLWKSFVGWDHFLGGDKSVFYHIN